MASSLEIFLEQKKHKQEKREKTTDWQQEKSKWIQAVQSLYVQVEKWLSAYKAKGLLDVQFRETQLTEDYLGTYSIQQMIISVSGEQVKLTPVGTLILGAYGRIDIAGDRSNATLLLVRKKTTTDESTGGIPSLNQLTWKWAVKTPHLQMLPLSEAVFSDILMAVMQGE